jgi:predicted nucleotidyltransferase
MTIAADVQLDEQVLADLCRRHGVARLSLFGSRLHGTHRPDSDLDLLVQFLPGQRVSLLTIGGMIMELRELTGLDVDLRTDKDLSPLFRAKVVREARQLYAA